MLKLTRQYFSATTPLPDGRKLPCPVLRVTASVDNGDLFPPEIFVYQARTLTADPRTGDPCTAIASLVQLSDLPVDAPMVGTGANRSIPFYRRISGEWHLNNEAEADTLWRNITEDVADLLANWNAVNNGILESDTASFDFANPTEPPTFLRVITNQGVAQGVLQLAYGVGAYEVTFDPVFSVAPTIIHGGFANTLDGSPLAFTYTITGISPSGFFVALSSTPDSNNYTFNWLALR